jgi:hypothetical protein
VLISSSSQLPVIVVLPIEAPFMGRGAGACVGAGAGIFGGAAPLRAGAPPVGLACFPGLTVIRPGVYVGGGPLDLENVGQDVLLPASFESRGDNFGGLIFLGGEFRPAHESYFGLAARPGMAAMTPNPLSWKSMGELTFPGDDGS